MTVLAKTRIVRNKTEFNFIATVDRYTQYLIYPSQVYQVLNVNWSACMKGILPTLQSHRWKNGTHREHQLGSAHLSLLPLTMGPTVVPLATVWATWLLMGCPKWWFLPPPTPTLSHPTPLHLPSHPPSLLSILTTERDSKKYHHIQSSEVEKVNYNNKLTVYYLKTRHS